jgi:hypothetical protein
VVLHAIIVDQRVIDVEQEDDPCRSGHCIPMQYKRGGAPSSAPGRCIS